MSRTLTLPANVETEQRNEPLELSPFQQRVMAIPEQYNIFLGGGRGGFCIWTKGRIIHLWWG